MRAAVNLSLALCLVGAFPLEAQRQSGGKIDGVEREKDKDRDNGGSSDCGCGGNFLVDIAGDIANLFVAHGKGRGYLAYPYAAPDTANRDAVFTVRRTEHGRSYGTIALGYFNDAGSTLSGVRLAVEGSTALAYANAEATGYQEPTSNETDHLISWRAGLGVLPRIGPGNMLKLGVGAHGLVLDDGSSAIGPELELGIQMLPRRPWGLSSTGHLAALSWDGGAEMFALRELNTTVSLFMGRFELQGGWHWMKVGAAPAFGGPTLGTRLWF